MHINFFNVFNVKCGFYNIKLISQKSNQVILLARLFLQRIMFIKFISTLPERLKKMKLNCLYSTFCGEIKSMKTLEDTIS